MGCFSSFFQWLKSIESSLSSLPDRQLEGKKTAGKKVFFYSAHFSYKDHGFWWCCRLGLKASYRSGLGKWEIPFLSPQWPWVGNHNHFDQSLTLREMQLCECLMCIWFPILCSSLQMGQYYPTCLADQELMCAGIWKVWNGHFSEDVWNKTEVKHMRDHVDTVCRLRLSFPLFQPLWWQKVFWMWGRLITSRAVVLMS